MTRKAMKRTDIQNIYALSPMQEGMLFHYQFDNNSALYFEQTFIEIEGALDIVVFEKTFNALIRKHEVLRTVFTFQKTQKPRQVVFRERRAVVLYRDLSCMDDEKQRQEMDRFGAEDRARGFDLGKDLLMRIALFKTGESVYHAVWSFHHIIMDGWCFGILMKDFMELYHQLLRDRWLEQKPTTPYSTYISWLKRQDKKAGLVYWKDYLAGFQGGIQLPKRTFRESKPLEEQRELELQLDSQLTQQMADAARNSGATLNAFFMALWGILLGRLTHSDDIVFGCVVSGRPAEVPGIQEMVGLFINTVPFRVQTANPEVSFSRLLGKLQEGILRSQAHEFVPLVEIMEQTPLSRDLFDHIIGFENYPLDRSNKPFGNADSTFTVKGLRFFEQTNYDLSIVVIPTDNMRIRFKYNSSVYREALIRQLAGALSTMAFQAAYDPELTIRDIRLMEGDIDPLLRDDSPAETFLPFIQRQIEEAPDRVAVVSTEGMITREVLWRLSRKKAKQLLASGCRPGDIVAVSTDRSLEWLIFTLSILQASLIYMPIDKSLPPQRKQFMISDSGCKIALTDHENDMRVAGGEHPVEDQQPPTATDPAYLIYTSGSTGRPKGVLVEHGAAANFYLAIQEVYRGGFSSNDHCFVSTGIGFDVSVAEWLIALCSGAASILHPAHDPKDGISISRALLRQCVTFCYIAPALLEDVRLRLARGGAVFLNKLLVGVEPIDCSTLDSFLRLNPQMTVVNGYGPTETTICATMHRYRNNPANVGRVPIGKSLPHMTIELLDHFGHPVPDGLPGEIVIGGRQLARGYLNNPELTAERFAFSSSEQRLYKTGDRAFVLEDGNLEFIGRFDSQVKIRGYRIELGEIEMALRLLPGIRNAVVKVVSSQTGNPLLCAYVVTQNDSFDEQEARLRLSESLPDYMLPVSIATIPSLPLTPNGKINRRALPDPALNRQRAHVPAEGPVQIQLVKIWSDVLCIPVDRIGIDDNFFVLGGHSIKAAAVASRVLKELEVNLPLQQLFRQPTIRSLEQFIEGQAKNSISAIPPCEKREYYPLSSAQKRLLVVTGMGEETTSYNMPFFLELIGELNVERIRAAFEQLLERHQSLRTSFRRHGSETVQVISPQVDLSISYYSQREWPEGLKERFVQSFDLTRAPLLRVSLAQMEARKHLLLMDMHHIVSDGTSIGLLLKEFITLYSGGKLQQPGIDYCDYAVWQAEGSHEDRIGSQRFWLQQFSDPPPVLNLPLDFSRPRVKDFAGDVVRFECEMTGNPFDATLFAVLLAVYNVLLARLSGQEDIVVGVPSAGRQHPSLEPVVGMLVNTLALRNFPTAGTPFADFLSQLWQRSIQAFDHQEFQLEELVAKLPGSRDPGRNPLFDTFFVFQNMEIPKFALQQLAVTPHPHPKTTAKFDLLLEATEASGTIYFALEYRTALFHRRTVERVANYFQTIFYAILDNPQERTGSIDILSPEEKRRILELANGGEEADFPHPSVHQWFSAVAQKRQEAIAVIDGDICLSYSFIDSVSHRGAATIASLQPGLEAIIGLLSEAGADLVPAILSILKAGCLYMPLDPQYPADRKQYMVGDSAAVAILTGRRDLDLHWLPKGVATLPVDSFLSEENPVGSQAVPNNCHRDSALYVIYTSGSTGFPKGVVLEHGNLMNLILFQMRHTDIDARRVLQFASPGFDVSLQEIFSTLLSGGCLCFMDHGRKSDPLALASTIARYAVHTIYLPTSYLKFFYGKGQEATIPEPVSHIVAAGEQLVISPKLRSFLNTRSVTLHNHYGPSETHVVTTLAICPQDPKPELPSIGNPISGTSIHILDKLHNLQPIGVAGELWITGPAVGRGYLNRPELTQEKFVSGMYRTGDLARLKEDGTIEFLGRIDNQVKIRGFRVEPGEIESLLCRNAAVKGAAVIHRKAASGEHYLCAYIDANSDAGHVSIPQLKSYLSAHLPQYMVPAFIMELPEIPITVNGKVNRALLPEPELQAGETAPPRPGTESKMASIWAEILELDAAAIGREANFFEIGGHSLKATMLAARIHQAFYVKLQLQEIFKHPILKDLGKAVEEAEYDGFEPIPVVEKRDYYPLSSAQKRMFVLNRLKRGHISDNISLAVLVEGHLDVHLVEKAVQALCFRHESLRTCFLMHDRQPVQRIRDRIMIQLESLPGPDRDQALAAFIRPFDLAAPPLLRIGLRPEGEGRHVLVMDMHHIITDGISIRLLLREFLALLEHRPLERLDIQYKDYACWQSQSMERGILKRQEEYWLAMYSELPPALELPYDFPEASEPDFAGESVECLWDGELSEGIKGFEESNEATLYMVMAALFTILLSHYADLEDIVTGTPVAGRRHPAVEGIAGFFVNTLAMRHHPLGHKSFLRYLLEVKDTTIQALQNQDYPFEELVARLGSKGQYRNNPLFDVMLSVENTGLRDIGAGEGPIGGLRFTHIDTGKRTTQFHLTLQVYQNEGNISLNLRYSRGRFKRNTAYRLLGSISTIAEAVVKAPGTPLGEIDVISAADRQFLLERLSGSRLPYDRTTTFPPEFSRQVDSTPYRTALTALNSHITFDELKRKVDHWAGALQALGVGKGSIVAISVDPSLEMMLAILAIFEVGGAYLPISASFPQKRIQYMLKDSSPALLITGLNQTLAFEGQQLSIQQLKDASAQRVVTSPQTLAYIIYTSGSTGKPKGVAVRQNELMAQLTAFTHRFQLGVDHRTLLSSSVTFDASVILLFPPLLSGGSLVLAEEGVRKDPRKMLNLIQREAVDTMFVVPAYLHALLETTQPENLRFKLLFIGGDIFPTTLYNRLGLNPKIRQIVNIYGPTETTVEALVFSSPTGIPIESASIPIGKPLPNYKIAIMNRHGRQVPIGVAGEIWIGGAGVSAGYLNRVHTTHEVFITDSHQERWYRTGDRGLVREDGNILFLGRLDFQVKIRGFRIETGDIAAAFLKNPSIKEAAVVAAPSTAVDNQLHAFLVPSTGERLDMEAIRSSLELELPDYMIPRFMTVMNELPINSNGKVDRQALMKCCLQRSPEKTGFEPPQTPSERALAAIWSEILGIGRETIGRDDHFFQLGGHSLNAAVLNARLRKRLGVDVPLVDLFKNPVLKEMGQLLETAAKSGSTELFANEKRDFYPLSSPQKRFYYVQQTNSGTISYNMAYLTKVAGRLDRLRLRRAIQQLCQKHESFRTYFVMNGGQPVQRVLDTIELEIEEYSGMAVEEAAKRFIRPFDLKQAPLLRVGLVDYPGGDTLLAIDMHHIIGDGVSMGVIISELTALYQGETLIPQHLQYRDFALWQQGALQGFTCRRQMTFWKEMLGPPLPVLDLAADFKRPAVFENTGNSIRYACDPRLSAQLLNLSHKLNCTLYMLLAALFGILLEKYSRQQDIIIGSVVAGRRHEELEAVIGLFTNTLPLRLQVRGELGFGDFAAQTAQSCVAAFDNQDIPFEELVAELNPRRDPSRNPLFDAAFGMVHRLPALDRRLDLTFTPYSFEAGTSKFDLSLLAEEGDEGLSFLMEYRSALFRERTIQRMGSHFLFLLQQIVSDPNQEVRELSLLSNRERHIIVNVFNGNEEGDIPRATFWELFAQAAADTPDGLAVAHKELHVTYETLAALASEFSQNLRLHHRLRGEDRVGVGLLPSVEWAIALMGVMKTGAAAIPLEPELPQGRIDFMCRDAAVAFVVDQTFFADFPVDRSQRPSRSIADELSTTYNVYGLAYIIYTSGTTGIPKGVAVSHQGLGALRLFQRRELGISTGHRVLQFARISFDGAMFELAAALFNSAALCIPSRDIIGNFSLMENFLQRARITVAVLPPPYLAHLSTDLRHYLEILVSAGSETSLSQARRWGAETRFFNGYGPTETTVAATVWRYDTAGLAEGSARIPIGKPIPGTTVFIMDRQLRLLPPLVPGELCVGGCGLARGYLNNPELTARAFSATDHGFVYRSGDLARYLPDGGIEFLGRIDQQVKIRGQRVELQEIEQVILQSPFVAAATVVVLSAGPGESRLSAYVVPTTETHETGNLPEELTNHLAGQLPSFMVPSYIMTIDRIPLTVNGKVDREALPLPQIQRQEGAAIMPRNEIERQLLSIWARVLELPGAQIGIESDFFQLGGHSLKLTLLLSRILKELNVTIPLVTAIAEPTIAAMCRYIKNNSGSHGQPEPHPGIVLLKKGDEPHHLFLVHDGFGRIDGYRQLALQAGGNQWIWGIEMDLPDKSNQQNLSINDIAASYIRKIEAMSISWSRSSVGGWSLGGLIAFEMASQWESRGVNPQNLLLFDTIPPFADSDYLTASNLTVDIDTKRLLSACRDYNPTDPIETPVLFVDAKQSPHPSKDSWNTLCKRLFPPVKVDCTHHQLFDKKNVDQFLTYVLPM
jgi:amino acid adenylation domain-containing protein